MLLRLTPKKISARLFGPKSVAVGAGVVSVGVALDALAAELRRHVDTQAIIEAMTTNANEFFFLAAVSMLPIVAQCGSRRIGS